MPIRIFLDRELDFDAEPIEIMSRALAGAFTALGITAEPDDLKIVLAKKIIELAKAGERDPERLMDAALKALRQ